MKEDRPVLVTYIADLNFLNAFLLIVSLIVSLFPEFMRQYGVITPEPAFFSVLTRIFAIVTLLIISYGLLRLKKWGYRLMVAYNMFYLAVSVINLIRFTERSLNFSGLIVSVLGLSLILPAKRYFIKADESL